MKVKPLVSKTAAQSPRAEVSPQGHEESGDNYGLSFRSTTSIGGAGM